MVQRHHEQITKPILNLGKLDLTLLYLTGIVGKLIIYKIEIELTRNTDILGKMDPYASLQLGNRKYTTETRNDEGMHAVWNVAYEFDLKDAEEILKIDVFDKDALEDDYVCGS